MITKGKKYNFGMDSDFTFLLQAIEFSMMLLFPRYRKPIEIGRP